MDSYINLNRQFSPVIQDLEVEKEETLSLWGQAETKTWEDLDKEFRSVILAEAGAGKTEELRQRAQELSGAGKPSFFIRIEDIEPDFRTAFEIGNEEQFQSWLNSTTEAWFFLDSVDEARLENPRVVEKALRKFAKGIRKGAHRAHIYLSSRPYAWRPKEDRKLLDELLFLPKKIDTEENNRNPQTEQISSLSIFALTPLIENQIRTFCEARSAENIDHLIQEIERANLWSLAERPFDLEGILSKWDVDKSLGGRLELLRFNIDARLRDEHNTDRAQRQPLNLDQARQGARRLAAAVLLTGKSSLNVPGAKMFKFGNDAEDILNDWHPKDVHALLERGIFNDIIYGAVRFRHREIRELLAAEWFNELLKTGNNREEVESLFFREQYDEKIITPRLRPILPWLVLFDDGIRHKTLSLHPELATEGGDPSRLPLKERQKILRDIVRRIAANEDVHSARDHSSIARIASKDLENDAKRLVDEFLDNDDAIFFLGRFVWQGKIISCIEPFITIATSGDRGIYSRIASARAVMTCGSEENQENLWQQIRRSDSILPRKLVAVLVQEAPQNLSTVEHLLAIFGKLTPYKQFQGTGLTAALLSFIERIPIEDNQKVINRLIDGMHTILEEPPFIERRECHVSEEFAWMTYPATRAVERLVQIRSDAAIMPAALSILLMTPALRYWRQGDFHEHDGNLRTLVPHWPLLNDTLYWASIEKARSAITDKSEKEITVEWAVSWLNHYWSFDIEDLHRLLEFTRSRPLEADKLIALSSAYNVYARGDSHPDVLAKLVEAAAEYPILEERLDKFLNPPVSDEMKEVQEEETSYKLERKEEEERRTLNRNTWIASLRANPDRVRQPPGLTPGAWTNDQQWLLHETLKAKNKHRGENWETLIPEFGEEIATSFRDAAVSHWRNYKPTLCSDGDLRDGTPYALIFAMTGLEIEATENPKFPHYLEESEILHALRYITWELNGFPSWLERLHRAFPSMVAVAVLRELSWELKQTQSEKPLHYILQALTYDAPWLHETVSPTIVQWFKENPTRNIVNDQHCLQIICNGSVDVDDLSALAHEQITLTTHPDSIPTWFALRVDCTPEIGILELEQWLATLNKDIASHAAQIFIVALMGGRHRASIGLNNGNHRTVENLKTLYVLMHKYVREEEDIDRSGSGSYSPELRDDAQDARDRLLNLLSAMSGKEAYTAIRQLERDQSNAGSRSWMSKCAYRRAEEDGDLEAWEASQLAAFEKDQSLTPSTHRQLFDMTIHRLIELKNWLERGNDSPWQTWQRVKIENEMRTLVAGWLNQRCDKQYTTAQEPELANSQRMDIWMDNQAVKSPVPIELKLVSQNWSGPKLCERLLNQLVGDYLREENASCGVMLLIWPGGRPNRQWEINGRRVGIRELGTALKSYWQGVSDQHLDIEAIEVVVIDLTTRGRVSGSS